MSIISLVLSAGKGTRMQSNLPKVMHDINGIPMIEKVRRAILGLNPDKIIFILGYKKEIILDYMKDIDYVVQNEQLGTGHAIEQAREVLSDFCGDVLVINGDLPLIKPDTLKSFYNNHKSNSADASILTTIVENPYSYGRIVEKDNKFIKIVEEKDADAEEKKIKKINVGAYIFKSKLLFEALKRIDTNNINKEYYLTDVFKILSLNNKKVVLYNTDNNLETSGVNSQYELYLANLYARQEKNISLIKNGVRLVDINNCYISEDVIIGNNTVIYPNVVIEGKSIIGCNCIIKSNSRISESEIKDNVIIDSSVIESSILENDVTVGPFAHLRPNSYLREKVHIGNFVEIKNSKLDYGVKAGHLSYLGDATIGEKTNIGAGTVTCNYDGKNKFKTEIGKQVFVGSDSMLVAPVKIGDEATIAAGSVITKDVPPKALGVARSKQSIIEKWRKI